MYLYSLSKVLEVGLVGGKAAGLSQLFALGVSVPRGYAVSKELLNVYTDLKSLPPAFSKELVNCLTQLNSEKVIVRSSANIQSGGRSKASAIIHGFLLLISVILIPRLLNMIPLSVLAAILFIVGFKLAKPSLFKKMYNLGWKQSVPFFVTVLGIVFIDLLWGIGLGLIVGIVVILMKSYQNSHFLHIEDKLLCSKFTLFNLF